VVVLETDTHRSERLSAYGSASEYYIGVVILVDTEETLERRLVAETARQL